MNFKRLCFASLCLMMTGTMAAITSGSYLIKSHNGKYLTENSSTRALVCSDRRSGSEWRIAAMNGTAARTVTIPLSFLSEGRHEVTIYEDDPQASTTTHVAVRKQIVNCRSTRNRQIHRPSSITLNLQPSGGAVLLIK